MRFMLKVNIPNDAGNAAARAGMLGKTIKAILDEQKPEAVYFTDDRGQRCGYLFIEGRRRADSCFRRTVVHGVQRPDRTAPSDDTRRPSRSRSGHRASR